MKKTRLILLGMIVGSIAACSTTRTPAPVVERRTGGTTANTSATSAVSAPQAPRVSGPGYYTVKRGDTLYRIALEFGQSYRDIVTWNNLDNANDIKVDQVLRVQPPDGGGSAVGAAQVGNVSSGSGVEVRPLGAVPSSQTSASAVAGSNGGNKTSPRGDKRPYSESALVDLQKPDAPSSAEVPSEVRSEVKPEVKPVAPKNGEKAAPPPVATNGDEDRVDWMWPAEGKLIGKFDQGKKGIDIAGKSGQTVLAAAAGKVMYAGSGIRGYGNLVIVKHTNNLLSAYAHNKVILVKEGQVVSKGQKIAEMGNSDSDATKLHFEIRQQGKPVDPSKFLPSR